MAHPFVTPRRVPLHPVARAAFVLLAAWICVVAAWGRTSAWWWTPGVRWTAAVPIAALCVLAAARPTLQASVWASGAVVCWSVVQTLRYVGNEAANWRSLVVAGSTYSMVGFLTLALGFKVAEAAAMQCARERMDGTSG